MGLALARVATESNKENTLPSCSRRFLQPQRIATISLQTKGAVHTFIFDPLIAKQELLDRQDVFKGLEA